MANDPKSTAPSQPQKSASFDLEARIAQLEIELAAEKERSALAEARAEGSSRPGYTDKQAISATRHKPLWPFRVRVSHIPKLPANSPPHPALPEQQIDAVDESEAIRQYCLLHRDEHARQLDPTRYSFSVVCLKENDRKQQQVNRINNRRLVADNKLPVLTREQELQSPQKNLAAASAA